MCAYQEVRNFSLREVSKYGVISGPYFPVFGLNIGKYGHEKTPYLGTFHAVFVRPQWMMLGLFHVSCIAGSILPEVFFKNEVL